MNGGPQAARFIDAPPLIWPEDWDRPAPSSPPSVRQRADGPGGGSGSLARLSLHCTFCAKENFRDGYRRRLLPLLLAEIDGLLARGVEYIYFIDEIFLPNRPLLAGLAERQVRFGVQTRIDLWKPEMLELLGRAGCVSIEAGVEHHLRRTRLPR